MGGVKILFCAINRESALRLVHEILQRNFASATAESAEIHYALNSNNISKCVYQKPSGKVMCLEDKTYVCDIKPDLLRSVGTRGNKAMIYASGMCFKQLLLIPYADKITPEPILNNNEGRDTKADSIRNSYNSQFKVGIYGWRKKCLYILVMALMFIMIINLALTLWVLKVLDFNSEGMGQLRIVPGGLQLLGQALVLDSLFASSIKSRRGQPISIESTRNFTVCTRDTHGSLQSRLYLGHDRLEVNAGRLEVRDSRGALMLGAGQDSVTVGAENLVVSSPGGATFHTAVQTPLVRAPPSKQLVLESPTRSLEMHAAQSIAMESRAGDISASCLTTFRLRSVAGSIRLEAPSIYMPKLKSALPLPPSTPHSHDPHHQNIYQLCACANGKLFLAPPHGACAAREESLICR